MFNFCFLKPSRKYKICNIIVCIYKQICPTPPFINFIQKTQTPLLTVLTVSQYLMQLVYRISEEILAADFTFCAAANG